MGRRARDGDQYTRFLLAEASGVAEAKFVSWLSGDAVSRDDDGDLMAVVRTLALWAGQSMPEPRVWLALATATRKDQATGIWRKLGGLLTKKPPAVIAGIGGIGATVIAGVILLAVTPLFTSSPDPQPTSAAGAPLVPFGVTVSRTNGQVSDCAAWLFPKPIQEIPYRSLSGGQDAAADEVWAFRNGAADVDGGGYTITLQGFSSTDNVIIRDVRIEVLSRKPAPGGTVISETMGCGGGLAAQLFRVEVDSPDPQFVAENGATRWPYTISGTDVEYLVVSAGISPSDRDEYQFVYKIDWSQGSRQDTMTVRAPDGKPFTAVPNRPGSGYTSDNGHWNS